MKKLDDICFIVQARLNSQRVPQKMIKPFAGSNLFELIIDKLIFSDIIPRENIFASVHEDELKQIAYKNKINIFDRSYESANNDNSLQKIYEWHDKLPYKYCVLISGCNPLLRIHTIDNFVNQFLNQDEENLFAVFEKKQYYWNKEGALVTPWPKGQTIMNTKAVEPTYEAAHVLYASRLDLIKENRFMGDFEAEGGIKLFQMDELEAFDIDEPWQFEVAEVLYEKYTK
jgi:CMP-N-acetylneuraminic acid synthetase|tara:strand:+ start:342 stop:1028 length:687 start_codon:yes stop_codon:yes gene_type:complete